MALKATIYKAELQVSDMDRQYYANHALTLAQHPSETEERLMIRLLAFALHANELLEFGRGLSTDDEPDLWRKSLTGEIEQWIELGQPDEQRIRKACGRARQVVVISYSGRGADVWWDKIAAGLARSKNLTVMDIPAVTVQALASLAESQHAIAVPDPRRPGTIDEPEGERVGGTNAAHGTDGSGVLTDYERRR
jgi:uncharacterized protein YaeQ